MSCGGLLNVTANESQKPFKGKAGIKPHRNDTVILEDTLCSRYNETTYYVSLELLLPTDSSSLIHIAATPMYQ